MVRFSIPRGRARGFYTRGGIYGIVFFLGRIVDLVDLVLLGVGKMDGWQGGEGRG